MRSIIINILLLDIETSPLTVFSWGIWEQNISLNAIKETSSVLCWSARFLGEKGIRFDSVYKSGKKKMLQGIHKLLDEADIVISYNGIRFDIPTLNKEFLLAGMKPPSPYKQIDLLRTARSNFKFVSNKLDFVAQALGVGSKTKHPGFQLWIDCMNGDAKAWKLMEKYNKQDVVLLEKVYARMLPWIKGQPNVSISGCPRCGEHTLQKRGTATAGNAIYQRVQCTSCGGWSKGDKITSVKAKYRAE